jgi:hypothetical protein
MSVVSPPHARKYDTSLILEEEEKEGRPAKRD